MQLQAGNAAGPSSTPPCRPAQSRALGGTLQEPAMGSECDARRLLEELGPEWARDPQTSVTRCRRR